MQNTLDRGLSATRSGLGAWAGIGALMGIFAGLVFALFQLIMATAVLGPVPSELIVWSKESRTAGYPYRLAHPR